MTKTYLKLLGFGALLTLLISIFSAVGMILKLDNEHSLILQISGSALAAGILVGYMLKKGKGLQSFGFQKGVYTPLLILFMALIVFVQPLVMGFNHSLAIKTVGLIVIQMLLVGFVEETLFRAIYLYFLAGNTKKFILFSSLVFGVLHGAVGIDPEFPLMLVILQIVNALLLGVIFSLIYLKTQSIYTTIFFHAMFNILATVALDTSIDNQILAVSILVIIYLVFIFYLVKTMAKTK